VLFVILGPATGCGCAHLRDQLLRRADRSRREPLVLDAFGRTAEGFVVETAEQHLADGCGVQRSGKANARVHPQRLPGFDLVDVRHRSAFVRGEMHGLPG